VWLPSCDNVEQGVDIGRKRSDVLRDLACFSAAFREYPGIEYNDFPLPADWQRPAEFMFATADVSAVPRPGCFRLRRPRRPRLAKRFSIWTQDYPRADRHFLQAIRRLTRIDSRSVEQPVNLDDGDDVYNYPFFTPSK